MLLSKFTRPTCSNDGNDASDSDSVDDRVCCRSLRYLSPTVWLFGGHMIKLIDYTEMAS